MRVSMSQMLCIWYLELDLGRRYLSSVDNRVALVTKSIKSSSPSLFFSFDQFPHFQTLWLWEEM